MTDRELEKIYNDSYRSVYWTALSLMKDEEEAEDIVQDTFVILIDSYDTLTDKKKVLPWLKKIAANRCLNRLTRNRTVNCDDEFLDNAGTVPEDFLPDSIIESDEKRKIIMDIIDRSLSEDVRRTIILFYFDEMTTEEISEAMGIPQGTVLSRLNFARKKIKKEVQKYEEENDDRLFAMALPFLSKLFIKEAEQVPMKPMPASLKNLSASESAPHKGGASKFTAASAAAATKGTGTMLKKVIIGIASLAVLGGATAGVVHFAGTHDKNKTADINETTTAVQGIDGDSASSVDTDQSDITEETDVDYMEELICDGSIPAGGYTQYEYIYKDDGTQWLAFVTTYDADGNKVEYITYHSDMTIDDHWSYVYDDNGMKLAQYLIDDDGNAILASEFDREENGCIYYTHYNTRTGEISGYSYTEYDDQGRAIGFYSYDADDNLISYNDYIYDADGYYTMIRHEADDGNSTYDELWYRYNPDGEPVEFYRLDDTGEEHDYYTLSDSGDRLRCDTYIDGELTWYEEYVYDENGLLVAVQSYDPDGGNEVTASTYEYTFA